MNLENLVNSIDKTTTAGAEMYAELLGLSGQFASLIDAENKAGTATEKVKNSLMSLADAQEYFDSTFNNSAEKLADAYGLVNTLGGKAFEIDFNKNGRFTKPIELDMQNLGESWANYISVLKAQNTDAYESAIKNSKTVKLVWDDIASKQKEHANLVSQLNSIDQKIVQQKIDAENKSVQSLRDSLAGAQKLHDASMKYWTDNQKSAEEGRKYLLGLSLNKELSGLTARERLIESKNQFDTAIKASNIADSQKAMSAYLQVAREQYGSADQYKAILDATKNSFTSLVDSVSDTPKPDSDILNTAKHQLTVAESTLNILKQQLDLLKTPADYTKERADLVSAINKLDSYNVVPNAPATTASETTTAVNNTVRDLATSINSTLNTRRLTDNAVIKSTKDYLTNHANIWLKSNVVRQYGITTDNLEKLNALISGVDKDTNKGTSQLAIDNLIKSNYESLKAQNKAWDDRLIQINSLDSLFSSEPDRGAWQWQQARNGRATEREQINANRNIGIVGRTDQQTEEIKKTNALLAKMIAEQDKQKAQINEQNKLIAEMKAERREDADHASNQREGQMIETKKAGKKAEIRRHTERAL